MTDKQSPSLDPPPADGERAEGSRLRQKLVHLQYRAKLQEHITLTVKRIRETGKELEAA
jgi:hypothetical protein